MTHEAAVLDRPAVEAPAESDVIAETLRWVNDERVKMGKAPIEELPKGEPDNPWNCPLALALNSTVCSNAWGENIERVLPPRVQEFRENFDAGLYPELIA